MAQRRTPRIYQAADAFYFGGVLVSRGETAVEGHPVMKGRKHLFRPFQPTYGTLEPDDAPPADAAPAATTASAGAAAGTGDAGGTA